MECWMYCLLAISPISVGCTIIEMAIGKPPWSQQYKEVAALFYIGTTKSHPPIPEHLSLEAKDFLLKCLQDIPLSLENIRILIQYFAPLLCPSWICNCGLKDEDGFLMDKLHHASEGRGSGGKEVENGLVEGGLGKIEDFPDRFVASTPEKDCLQKESSTNSQPRTDYSSRSCSRLWARRRLVSASAVLNLFSPWRSGGNSDKVELTVVELESLRSEIVAAEEREVHLKDHDLYF